MTPTQFCLLAATMYITPHLPKNLALACGASLILIVIFSVIAKASG